MRQWTRRRLWWVLCACALSIGLAPVQSRAVAAQASQGGAEISAPSVVAVPWTAQARNTVDVQGTIMLDGEPVAGAIVTVGGYPLPASTNAQGQFTYPVDQNLIERHPVRVKDASGATVGGEPVGPNGQQALQEAVGGINVHYVVTDVVTSANSDGSIVVSGTLQFANGQPPPPVVLYSYRLTGTVTTTAGEPVEGVLVSTNTSEFRWTFSDPTGPQGVYTSLYWPTETSPFRVLLIEHNDSFPVENDQRILFPLYRSARMDVTLDRESGTISVTEPVAIDGLIYDGVLVGVMQDGAPVRPLSATWPDQDGRFQMVLPAELAGQTVEWWQQSGNYFSTIQAEPGGQIGLEEWPTSFDQWVPRGFGTLELPGG